MLPKPVARGAYLQTAAGQLRCLHRAHIRVMLQSADSRDCRGCLKVVEWGPQAAQPHHIAIHIEAQQCTALWDKLSLQMASRCHGQPAPHLATIGM